MGTILFGNKDINEIARYRYGPPCRLVNRCQVVQIARHQAAYAKVNTIAVIVICCICTKYASPVVLPNNLV